VATVTAEHPYDQVAAVLAATTAAPWRTSGTKANPHWYVSSPECLVHGPHLLREPDTTKGTVERWIADARFIALARNTYPELLAMARAAKWHTDSECQCRALTHSSTCQLVITEYALRTALSDLEAKIREVMP
jgi:hypothetical protein